jgi:hypothetical protein
MSYNPFRWYTSGKYRKKPLPQSYPLLLKIKNGDFEYSPFFKEADDAKEQYRKLYDEYMNTSYISDINDRMVEAHQYAKMKHVRYLKLNEKADEEEQVRLHQLRLELAKEFGQDLWEEVMDAKLKGGGTTEDLYWWYKEKTNMGTTPSEMAIKLGRKSTNGLRPQ